MHPVQEHAKHTGDRLLDTKANWICCLSLIVTLWVGKLFLSCSYVDHVKQLINVHKKMISDISLGDYSLPPIAPWNPLYPHRVIKNVKYFSLKE